MTDFHDDGGNERRRHGKKRRGPNEELEPNKLHGARLASHRNKLESTCPVEDALSASADGWRGFVEVATSEELENVFATTGLDKICVHRMGSRSKSDVFRTLHMSYPVQTLEEFKTRLARFVHEELTIPTIDVRTQSDGQPLNVIDVVKYFSEPAAKRKAILNITSFNLAHTGLDGLVVAPQIVRDLDLVSRVWPSQRMIRFYDDLVHNPFAFVEKMKIGEDATSYDVYSPPKTMTYLLLGPEGAYTDWHVDFAGSSVWYHVVKGKKVFMAAPGTGHNIRQFMHWSSSDDQNDFLGERLEKCMRLELNEGDTMFLPGGWFHAVSTPEDSVVVGGNYINPLRIKQLLTVRKIERQLDISSAAEYPKFDMLMYYAAGDFIKRCQQSREGRGLMRNAIVTQLEAKGLESLAAYLESVVEELESSCKEMRGRVTKEKRQMIENVEQCKGEVGLITSFLRKELERLKSVYTCDGSDVEDDLSFLDEAIFGDTSLARARRRARRHSSSDEDLLKAEEEGEEDEDDQDDQDNQDGEEKEENEDKDEDEDKEDEERDEDRVEQRADPDAGGSGESIELESDMKIILSSSDGGMSDMEQPMVGTRARRPLITDSSDKNSDESESDGETQEAEDDNVEEAEDDNEAEEEAEEEAKEEAEEDNEAEEEDKDDGVAAAVATVVHGRRQRAKAGQETTLKALIDAGTLSPGEGVISWKKKGTTAVADLTEDGLIEVEVKGVRNLFHTPSAFATWMGKQQGSKRTTCNGWEEIYYGGKLLSTLRDGGNTGNGRSSPSPAPLQETSNAPIPTGTGTGTASGTPDAHKTSAAKAPPPTSLKRVPAKAETGFLGSYREKGDDALQSKTEKLRTEALKKHSGATAAPLVSAKRTALQRAVAVAKQTASKESAPAKEMSAEASLLLKSIDELTTICNTLEKEQRLLAQVDGGTLSPKDGGMRIRENVRRLANEFNDKASRACAPLFDESSSKALKDEVMQVKPDFNQTIRSLIRRVNGGVGTSSDKGETADKGDKRDKGDKGDKRDKGETADKRDKGETADKRRKDRDDSGLKRKRTRDDEEKRDRDRGHEPARGRESRDSRYARDHRDHRDHRDRRSASPKSARYVPKPVPIRRESGRVDPPPRARPMERERQPDRPERSDRHVRDDRDRGRDVDRHRDRERERERDGGRVRRSLCLDHADPVARPDRGRESARYDDRHRDQGDRSDRMDRYDRPAHADRDGRDDCPTRAVPERPRDRAEHVDRADRDRYAPPRAMQDPRSMSGDRTTRFDTKPDYRNPERAAPVPMQRERLAPDHVVMRTTGTLNAPVVPMVADPRVITITNVFGDSTESSDVPSPPPEDAEEIVLTTKKKPNLKVRPMKRVKRKQCHFHWRGVCKKGASCEFSHDL